MPGKGAKDWGGIYLIRIPCPCSRSLILIPICSKNSFAFCRNHLRIGIWSMNSWNPPGPFSSFVSLASAFSASKCWECSLEYRLLEKRTGRMFTRLRAYPSENPIARQYSPHLISWGVRLTLTYSMLNLIPKTRITKNYPIYFDSDEILLPAQAWKIVSRL